MHHNNTQKITTLLGSVIFIFAALLLVPLHPTAAQTTNETSATTTEATSTTTDAITVESAEDEMIDEDATEEATVTDDTMSDEENVTDMETATTTEGVENESGDTIESLQVRIADLKDQLSDLQSRLQELGGTEEDTDENETVWTAWIEPNTITVDAEGSVDFTGRYFWNEEDVTVALDDEIITTAHADGGGNFSTGSLRVPMEAGTYTYTFTGNNSTITGSTTVTVQE